MADKINAIKIKQPNGSYSDQIPISVLVQNVQWDQNHSLLDALGSVDLSSSGKGNLQHQIDELDEDKISHDDFNSQLNEFLSEQIKEDTETWLEENINPGEGFGITTNLTLSGWAADAKAVGDAINAKTFPIDSTLSDSSTNPVQNKVVTSAISELNGSLEDLYESGADLSVYGTVSNYALKADGTYIADSNSEVKKYAVTEGNVIYLSLSGDNATTYQFQNQAAIVASNPSAVIIGSPVSGNVNGYVRVPEGATYLIVSKLKTTDTNVVKSAVYITDRVDANETAINEIRDSIATISLSAEIKTALIACFNNVAWVGTDGETLKQNLQDALFPPEPETLGYVKSGLIALWDGILNTPEGHDDSATKWTDLVNGHEFTAMNSVNKTWNFGTNCMEFVPTVSGGSTQQANCIICPNFGKSVTVEICIDWERNDEGAVIGFFTGEETGQDDLHIMAYSYSDKSIVIYNNTLDGNYSVSDITAVHGISATYGEDSRNCYIDGEQANQRGKTNSFSGSLPSNIGYKYLVVGGHPGYTFKGKVYSIRIYNRVLTASEVAANYAYDVARFNLG